MSILTSKGVYEIIVDDVDYAVQNTSTGIVEHRSEKLPEVIGYMEVAAEAWKRNVEEVPTLASIN